MKFLNKVYKALKIILGGIAIIFLLSLVPEISDFINTVVIEKLDGLINFNGTNKMGSVERLAIADMALKSGYGWFLGKGIGMGSLNGSATKYAGFLHFGLSSIGTFVYFMGLWFYIFYIIYYAFIQSNICNKSKNILLILNSILVFMLSVYSMYFTVTHLIVWSCLTFTVINISRGGTTYE